VEAREVHADPGNEEPVGPFKPNLLTQPARCHLATRRAGERLYFRFPLLLLFL